VAKLGPQLFVEPNEPIRPRSTAQRLRKVKTRNEQREKKKP
jgi:hypothetical protein